MEIKTITKIKIILGLIIIIAGIASFFIGQKYYISTFVLIIAAFCLLALAMNYSHKGEDRNAWDVWFFSMPGVIIALFFVGILGEAKYPEIWKWVAIALGGAAGLESLSSIIKEIRKGQ